MRDLAFSKRWKTTGSTRWKPLRAGMENNPDRHLACQQDLQYDFDTLGMAAQASGWSERQVSDALLALAVTRIMGLDASTDIRTAIRQAVAGLGLPN